MPNFFDIDVTRDQVIFKEGEAADKIYIIKEGEFGLCKKLIHKEKEQDNNIQDILDNP
jgi:CRP-like cAMP-binding protein